MRRLINNIIFEDILYSDDFYTIKVQEELLEDDAISSKEEAFMRGYEGAF